MRPDIGLLLLGALAITAAVAAEEAVSAESYPTAALHSQMEQPQEQGSQEHESQEQGSQLPQLSQQRPSQQQSPAYPQHLQKVGEAQLQWLWWPVYDARLFSASGKFQALHGPLLLQLHYHRDISRTDLLETTAELLQSGAEQAAAETETAAVPEWMQQLAAIWPDVRADDQLSFFLSDEGQGHFYFNGQWLGAIDDPRFGPAFLNIWLADSSLYPELSRRLRGDMHKPADRHRNPEQNQLSKAKDHL